MFFHNVFCHKILPEDEIWKISKYCAKMIFICSLIFLFLIKIRFPKGVSISEILTLYCLNSVFRLFIRDSIWWAPIVYRLIIAALIEFRSIIACNFKIEVLIERNYLILLGNRPLGKNNFKTHKINVRKSFLSEKIFLESINYSNIITN